MLKTLHDTKKTVQEMQENIIAHAIHYFISKEYNEEKYSWYDFEDVCDEWYMDHCNFWEDGYFHLLFDDSTPSLVENIIERNKESILTIEGKLCQF